MDDFVRRIILEANYRKYACCQSVTTGKNTVVIISFLPSMIREFAYENGDQNLNKLGFRPTKVYLDMTSALKAKILGATQILFEKEMNRLRGNGSRIRPEGWKSAWENIVAQNILFIDQNQRPLVIYPGNADRVVRDVCPEADLNIILLGKDVYRSIYFDRGKDVYPHINRIYLDISNIKYSRISDEIDHISQFIFSKLMSFLALRYGGNVTLQNVLAFS
jgi:hypothetical protein